mgnify:CR=1 FL=1
MVLNLYSMKCVITSEAQLFVVGSVKFYMEFLRENTENFFCTLQPCNVKKVETAVLGC